ncbi:MAG: PAS domain-containing protein [Bacteroidota bacterium]
MLKRLFTTGIKDRQPTYIQERILLANQIAFIIGLFVALPFVFISSIYFEPLTIYPMIGMIVCVAVILLNYFQLHVLARFMIAVGPFSLAAIYNAYLSQPGETAILAISILQLSFMLVPFLVIDIKERFFLASVYLLLTTWFVFFTDWANNFFHVELDNTIIKEGFLFHTSLAIGAFTAAACMIAVLVQIAKKDKTNAQLMLKMESKAQQLEDSEKVLQDKLVQIDIAKKEDDKRNWATEGLAKFGEILRSNDGDIGTQSDEIISNLVKYLSANQGSLFLLSDDEQRMVLEGCYAWSRKKYVEKKIKKGEGLIGQCWIEGEYIYMTDIPDSYISITSGLGEANPSSILIVPLVVNEKIHGVVEIASFNRFEDYQIEFVQKVSETIASALSTVKVNQQTKVLLEQSQQQAEEMRAQEEEIRQNMEEMQATQEELYRNQIEMDGKMAAINSANAVIEFDANGIILTANDLFLQSMQYSLDEIQGKHHRIFLDPNDIDPEEYQNFWNRLSIGKSFSGEIKRKAKDGSDVWLSASYTPIVESGKVTRIIKLARNITEEKRRNMNFENQIKAINISQGVIEFDLKGYIQNANDVFLNLMGYQLEEIQGKHHSVFCSPEYADSEAYKAFWDILARGEFNKGEFTRIKKNGEEVVLKATYTPILDSEGHPYKVIKFANEIEMVSENI